MDGFNANNLYPFQTQLVYQYSSESLHNHSAVLPLLPATEGAALWASVSNARNVKVALSFTFSKHTPDKVLQVLLHHA